MDRFGFVIGRLFELSKVPHATIPRLTSERYDVMPFALEVVLFLILSPTLFPLIFTPWREQVHERPS